MESGKLRHRLDLQSRTITQNAMGEGVEVWTTYATTWASIRPLTGRERFTAAQFAAEVTHQVGIRWRQVRPKAQDRAVFQGRVFRIDYVMVDDERRESVEMLCKEETP
jgi:SPP1 family predicted phage head-tail adaptor